MLRNVKRHYSYKRIISLLLCVCMVITMIPNGTLKAAPDNDNEEVLSIGDQVLITTKEETQMKVSTWQLVWNDEFEGNSLDETKWEYMVGTGAEYVEDGWGNQEQQYYTDGENAEVRNGHLIITAKKNTDSSKYSGKKYTSTRLWTKGDSPLFSKKYGRFEAKMSLPSGTGYWPAFWLMPTYDVYGTWASSGEIDIMEVRGRVTDTVNAAVHYGTQWPNNKHNGGAYVDSQFDTTKEHVYALEWVPGEIRWYVDNELYYSTSNFYSKGADEGEEYTYPAPFDQEFYILLNLAMGGNYDGNQLDETLDGGQMKVDYVRVYDYVDTDGNVGVYDENVQPPKEEASDLLGGEVGTNLVASSLNNITMIKKDYDTEGTDHWDLLTLPDFSGAATYEVGDGVKVNITSPGNQDYSIQLTHRLPLSKGYQYEVSFVAKADALRTMNVKLGEVGGSWTTYCDTFTSNLTEDWKEYHFTFHMNNETNPNARFEMNMGLNSSSIYIKDIVVKSTGLIKEVEPNGEKEPLGNGERIYNGTFDQGNEVDDKGRYTRLKFWNRLHTDAVVINDNLREVTLTSTGEQEGSLYQVGLALTKGEEYKVSIDGRGWGNPVIQMVVMNEEGGVIASKEVELSTTMTSYEWDFIMEQDTTTNASFAIIHGTEKTPVVLDNISMRQTSSNTVDYSETKSYLIGNKDFTAGTQGFSTHQTVMGVDTVVGGNLLWVATAPVSPNYEKMLLCKDLAIEKGISYTLKFTGRTTSPNPQPFTVRIQREGGDWASVLDKQFVLTDAWQDFEYTFTPGFSGVLNLKYLLGDVTENCNVNFSNMELYITSKPVKESAFLFSKGETKVNQPVILSYINREQWEGEEKQFFVNGKQVESSLVQVDIPNKTITWSASLFDHPGNYSLQIKVAGYDKTNYVTQTVLEASGNLVINGSFADGLNGWGNWSMNGCGKVSTENEEAKVEFIWHEGNTWDIQFFQENISLKAGKTYRLSFKAKASIARDIIVEFGKYTGQFQYAPIHLTDEYQTYTYIYDATSEEAAKLNFLLGNVNNLNNVNNPHQIYFDDVSIVEYTEEEPTVEPTIKPTVQPTVEPTVQPTIQPTVQPTIKPTVQPTIQPTVEPTIQPTVQPTIKPTTNPLKPAKVTISTVKKNYDNSVTVSWKKVSGATGYEIQIKNDTNGSYKKIKTITTGKTNTFTISKKLIKSSTQYIRVRAYKKDNGKTSYGAYSPSFKTSYLPKKVVITKLKKTSATSVSLAWRKDSKVSGYQVQMKIGKNGTYRTIKEVKGTSVTLKNLKLQKNKTYYFRICGYGTVNGVKVYGAKANGKSIRIN